MDHNGFSWERHSTSSAANQLSDEDIETISRLMLELREVTLSRSTYLAATAFLKRFGFDTDSSTLVRPDRIAH